MIGRAYRWLFDAHRHEWEQIKEEQFENLVLRYGEKIKTGEGTLYTLRCKKCGEITSRRVEV